MQRLSLPEQHGHLFHQILNALIDQGLIEAHHGIIIWKESQANSSQASCASIPAALDFCAPTTPLYAEDIFMPKHLTMNAVDGDTVEVLINSEVVSEKGPEGKVVTILSRGRTHIAGIIRESSKYGEILAYVPLLGTSQQVVVQPSADHLLKVGDRVVMEVLEWGDKRHDTLCRLSTIIGHISDPSCDIPAAIEEFELRTEFPHKPSKRRASLGTKVAAKKWWDAKTCARSNASRSIPTPPKTTTMR